MWWSEHWSRKKSSEVGDHLLVNPDYNITWRKLIKVFYIRKLKPYLNSQKDIKIKHLFRNRITLHKYQRVIF